MQYTELIKTALDYIEQNLKANITSEELAQMANYSTYHYYRLFSSVMGSSVASYILKRRLDHALAEIAGGRKAIDVVLEYGFDTYAGFYKAFVKMYGCSPKKYLSIYQEHKPKKPEVVIMYTDKELRKILENWSIEKNLPIIGAHMADGAKTSGNVWRVGNDYILKTGSREKLIKNIKISKALHKQGFVSSLPVLTKTGDEYLNQKEPFVLTQGLKGNPLTKSDRFGDSRIKFGEEYGRSIARLHKALKSIQKDILPDEVNIYENVTSWVLPNVKQQNIQWDMGIDDSFFDGFIEYFGKLYDKLPKQLIHRDPNPSNILFDGDKISGFIDFDLSEVNIRLWDVCYCATGILSESSEDAYEKWLDILEGILHGYDLEGKLTPEEKQAVFYVICSIQMICIAYFEKHDMYKELAKTNRQMLNFIIQNKEKIENIFK
ncbi:putative HTH-type transcriptional regulator ydeE [Proteiniborus sp. DW1]|uniref:helix-turn-helix domain-containing protein n=1 Tax=Proteiniborus sp. DW1 TaxID=1889883 RepID=UPI00092DF0F5|nr:helix-turn-helix domain-containing protein [Proteiniborus sp. DW1]SCG84366.1 putative HTH-type transcriptional regulator ydeE [Proteiniborus sp. DW1]